ncbi:cytosolic iron-sulfur assembly component 2B-like isoform X2 [Acropora millepora]|uniref:cytosolic iron-sulfur assembly component 2B-like isoform X2 n=1 Tax=Acropora millepora TaxID=45264 RepID=UPI001CF39CA8|nr:cytosolic iron-sulfur assembly component 2B-like isoform X2 [Acropora millepora]
MFKVFLKFWRLRATGGSIQSFFYISSSNPPSTLSSSSFIFQKNLTGRPGPAGLRRLSHHSSGAVKETKKMAASLQNANPMVFKAKQERIILPEEEDDSVVDKIDEREVFDLIRSINDPEHPLTLEQLNVVEQSLVEVDDDKGYVKVQFTPTIPHCSMATLIGLAIRVQLLRSLPDRFKVDVNVTPGSHASEDAVNKQLGDKERVAAALENSHLLELVNQCLAVQQ